jgi:hypothetical protein
MPPLDDPPAESADRHRFGHGIDIRLIDVHVVIGDEILFTQRIVSRDEGLIHEVPPMWALELS